MKYPFAALALALALAVSCKTQETSEKPVVPFVSELIQNRFDPCHQFLGTFRSGDPAGNIVLLGPLDEVRPLSVSMLLCERFDNIDGRPVCDSLPDFSGEIITRAVLTDPSFLRTYSGDNGMHLRELSVKAALAALDTLSYRTPNDLSSFSHKTRGKIVVLTNSAMTAYGKYDADSLLKAFGIEDVLFSPLELMADKALAVPESRIGIVSPQAGAVYSEYFSGREDASGHFIDVFPKESVLDSVSVVDSLALDILILDDYSVAADSLRARFPSATVLDPADAVCEACYKALRRRNAFTHRVAYPKRETFTVLLADNDFILVDSDDRELL